MGMFDYLKCKYPLPLPTAQNLSFQTKSLDCELGLYEIRPDGTLWREMFDISSEVAEPVVNGLGIATGPQYVNRRLEQIVDFSGGVDFYSMWDEDHINCAQCDCGWVEFKAVFVQGKLQTIGIEQNRAHVWMYEGCERCL